LPGSPEGTYGAWPGTLRNLIDIMGLSVDEFIAQVKN
jgi:hypothetical protein